MPTQNFSFSGSNFSLNVTTFENRSEIKMVVLNGIVKTKNLYNLVPTLSKNLPTIFDSNCINKNGLSFRSEVKDTQVGHLFEHMVLEYLCQAKVKSGYSKALYAGMTSWNWKNRVMGSFNINLNVGTCEMDYLMYSVKSAASLMDKIFFAQSLWPYLVTGAVTRNKSGNW